MYKLSFIAILEPRISGIGADKVADRLGFDGPVRVDAVGFSRGIWCFWKRRQISIDVVSTSKYCVLLKVNPRSPNPWLLAVLYGSPQERLRDELWTELRAIHAANDLPWCVIGNFNSVLHAYEKSGGAEFNRRVGQKFGDCIFDCGLADLGYHGPIFTWKSGELRQRLDHALGNTKWQKAFPFSSVVNLPLPSSDHYGVWLKLGNAPHFTNDKYFKFLGSWLDHDNFHVQVQNAWRNSDTWQDNITRLQTTLHG